MRVIARPEWGVFSAPPPVAAEAAQASLENCLNNHYLPDLCPSCARADTPLPPPARARIVLPRAAPQPMRPREPREPDTAEDAGGQTDHSGQAFQGGLEGRGDSPPSPLFHEFLESIYLNFEVLIWTESSILAQDERWRRA